MTPLSNTSSEVRFRPARRDDSAAVKDLVFGILRSYGLNPDPATTDADLEDPEASYARAGGRFTVVETSGGEIVGTVGILPVEGAPGVCELRKMYLHPQWRGRGLGRQLLEQALAGAAELEFKEMILETASVLAEAVALYQRYGFEVCESFPGHACASRCDMVMRRRVG